MSNIEEVQELVEKSKKRGEVTEYKRYLYLKAKFEGREDEFKDM